MPNVPPPTNCTRSLSPYRLPATGYRLPARHPRRRRGILAWEATVGLVLLATLLTALAYTLHRQHVARRAMADLREASRRAENALILLQAGKQPDPAVTLTPMPDPAPVPGTRWVQVQATVNNRHAQLVGLVPQPATPEARP